jgi:hypothetical protein
MRQPVDTPGGTAAAAARRLFATTLLGTLAVRIVLAWAFPVIGDEAYLFTWGRELAWGYYDHPPLAAWTIHPLFALGEGAPLALRLPSVLLYAVLALVLVRLLRPYGEAEAYLGGTLLLLVPAHVLGVLMLTDVPLVLFSALAGAALFRAQGEPSGGGDRLGWYAAAGGFLGLALLSKYLAALLAAAFLVWFLGAGKARRRVLGFALLVLCALPFVLQHLAWNWAHCWSTVLFNLYSRHAGESKNYSVPRNLGFFVLTYLYLASPPLLWLLGRRWRRLVEVARSPPFRPLALAFLVPTVLLLVAALTVVFGAYWALASFPFLLFLVPRVLPLPEMLRCIRFMALFTGAQVLALAVALALPLEAWKGASFYSSLVTMERTGELLERLRELEPGLGATPTGGGTHLAAPGYSLASLLSYRWERPVAVFGPGSHYARQDDLWTDYRELDGDDVMLVAKRPIPAERFEPFFEEVERREIAFYGATLHLAIGRRFDYERYRAEVLAPVGERYYRFPAGLPVRGCPFCERYFGRSGQAHRDPRGRGGRIRAAHAGAPRSTPRAPPPAARDRSTAGLPPERRHARPPRARAPRGRSSPGSTSAPSAPPAARCRRRVRAARGRSRPLRAGPRAAPGRAAPASGKAGG